MVWNESVWSSKKFLFVIKNLIVFLKAKQKNYLTIAIFTTFSNHSRTDFLGLWGCIVGI